MGGSLEPPFLLPEEDSPPEHVADRLTSPGVVTQTVIQHKSLT